MEDYSQYYTYRQRPKRVFNIGNVTKWLIIICAALYFIIPSDWYPFLMFNSNTLIDYPWTIISNAFLHGDFFHLLFNMFSLFLFGSLIELKHGSKIMVWLLLVSTVFSNLLFGFFNPGIYGLGISGYVYALIGAAVILEPNARVIFPIGFFYTTAPVKIAGPILFVGELLYSIVSFDGVGHIAHAAGFLIGLGVAYFKKKREPPVYKKWARF